MIKITWLTISALIIVACNTSKKSTTTVTPPAPVSANTNTLSTPPTIVGRSADGIHPPGNAELTAIQVDYKEVTMEKLKEGHELYTSGACINCHNAKNIYRYPVGQWIGIIDDMAQKARITDAQKDAVTKYVLAIKATQP